MNARLRKRLLFLVIIAYMAAMFVLAIAPIELPEVIWFDPKKLLLHFIEYAILGALLIKGTKRMGLSLSIGILYGVLLETIQGFVPYRVFDMWDMLANILGASLGTILLKGRKKL